MLRNIARVLAAVGMVCAVPVHALGLGEIEVRSKLNQRFSAVIPVIGASAQDLESLQVRMGPPEAFERAGVERADYLSTLEFKMDADTSNPTVTVSSAQVDREPFLNFLVEAHWNGGRLLREYTVLLDPPNLPSSPNAAAAPSSADGDVDVAATPTPPPTQEPPPPPSTRSKASAASHRTGVPRPTKIRPVPTHSAPTAQAAPTGQAAPTAQATTEPLPQSALPGKHPNVPKSARSAAAKKTAAASTETQTESTESTESPVGGGSQAPKAAPASQARTYGPVKSSETFWGIASRLRPSGATIDQTLLALCQANPGAFQGGRFDGLRPRVTLIVPSAETIKSVPAATATARIADYRRGTRISGPAKSDVVADAGVDATKPANASPAPSSQAPESAAAVEPAPTIAPKTDSSQPSPTTAGNAATKAAAETAPAPATPAASAAPSPPSPAAAVTAESPQPATTSVAVPPAGPSTPVNPGAASPADANPSAPPASTPVAAAPAAAGAPTNPEPASASGTNPSTSPGTTAEAAPGTTAAPTPSTEPIVAPPPTASTAAGATSTPTPNSQPAAAAPLAQATPATGPGIQAYFASVVEALKGYVQQMPSWLAALEGYLQPLAPLWTKVEPYKLPLLGGLVVMLLLIPIFRSRTARRKAELAAYPPSFFIEEESAADAPKTAPSLLRTHTMPVSTAGVELSHGFGDTARFDTQTIEVQPVKAPSPPVESTPVPPPTPPAKTVAPTKSKTGAVGDRAGLDITQQFEAQSAAVDLNANDPLSEADFHVAYGLYDEAAILLRQGLAKEPTRKDLRIKLCETYFAAGKALEYQEAARPLRGQVTAGEWQKLAIMGRQLAPGAELFKDDGAAAATEVDLALDEPAAPQVVPVQERVAPVTQVLPKASSPAAPPGNNLIEFNHDATQEMTLQLPASAKVDAPPPLGLDSFDFDAPAGAVSAATSHNTIEFDLDELDLGKPWSGTPTAVVGTDEIGTRLDLARAYADMGDNEAADGLLKEVMAGGNVAQRQEAEALSKRLHSA